MEWPAGAERWSSRFFSLCLAECECDGRGLLHGRQGKPEVFEERCNTLRAAGRPSDFFYFYLFLLLLILSEMIHISRVFEPSIFLSSLSPSLFFSISDGLRKGQG